LYSTCWITRHLWRTSPCRRQRQHLRDGFRALHEGHGTRLILPAAGRSGHSLSASRPDSFYRWRLLMALRALQLGKHSSPAPLPGLLCGSYVVIHHYWIVNRSRHISSSAFCFPHWRLSGQTVSCQPLDHIFGTALAAWLLPDVRERLQFHLCCLLMERHR